MDKSLTESQQMVLSFVESYSEENLRPPTVREIQKHCGYKSPRAVSYILEKLEEARLLVRQGRSRGIFSRRPEAVAARLVQIPLFDSIRAGLPDYFEGTEAPDTFRFVPSTLGIRNPQKAFSIRVKGDSMIEAGIYEGDLVILEKKEPRAGDIVAALIDGECTLKRLLKRGESFYLKAENTLYADLEPTEDLGVQGVVVSILRQLAEAA